MMLCSQWTMEPMHCASCQATLIEKLSNHNQNFCLSAWDDRSFDSDVLWNGNKTQSLLNKIINTGTNYNTAFGKTYHFPIVWVFGIGTVIGPTPKQKKDPDAWCPMPDDCTSFVCVFTRNNKSGRPESIGREFIRNRICQHSVWRGAKTYFYALTEKLIVRTSYIKECDDLMVIARLIAMSSQRIRAERF